MTTWVTIGYAAKLNGVTTQTIRNWTKNGEFEFIRTLGNHRRYSKEELEQKLGINQQKKYTICYSRVSANDEKEDLKRQSTELLEYCEKKQISRIEEISEIGSGLNYQKRGLKRLIDWIMEDKVERIVLSYKDRLVRFGLEVIEQICKKKNISIVVVNDRKRRGFEEELATDVISILTVYCAKIYGKRSHERRKKRQQENQERANSKFSDPNNR